MMKIFLSLTMLTLAFSSCKKDDSKGGIFKGPEQTFQHGKAWTWVELDKDQKPVRVAISIDAAAMNTLDPGNDQNGGHQHENSLSLQFAPEASVTPFTHALLDWNPHGHEPAGVYDQPHFDFHFYTVPEAERLAIPPYNVDSTGFLNLPGPDYVPAMHIAAAPVPQMGIHWIDVNSPELHGQLFTQTFLYGSYNGKVIFYEPMITKAFLDNNSSFERNFPVPAKFQKTGYYPTKMRIQKIAGITNIILEGFVYRQQS